MNAYCNTTVQKKHSKNSSKRGELAKTVRFLLAKQQEKIHTPHLSTHWKHQAHSLFSMQEH